ncbi:universal stress protein [Lyngbya confervoides]|uniref:Universal stress protein n=1 Tax=Lyngbya confervoides BDU141951 TaxID=1574623 RepID=A0ABD4SZL7_9CYAN|nr:universal stress protein [Lyngbya confervoides]MCM1981834.1 universal stress protein [Lyngbya confervoides BDU141951]
MFKRIILAVDLLDIPDRGVDEVIQLAQNYGAEIMFMHVLSFDSEAYPLYSLYPLFEGYSEVTEKALEDYEACIQAHEQHCLAQLREFQQRAKAVQVRAQVLLASGNPGPILCDQAQAWKADVVIMGNRGRRGIRELFLGSVSNYVMHHAPCSVLILRDSALSTLDQPPPDQSVPQDIPMAMG